MILKKKMDLRAHMPTPWVNIHVYYHMTVYKERKHISMFLCSVYHVKQKKEDKFGTHQENISMKCIPP